MSAAAQGGGGEDEPDTAELALAAAPVAAAAAPSPVAAAHADADADTAAGATAPEGAPERPLKSGRDRARSAAEFVLTLAVALAIAYAVQAFLIKPYRIPSGSMEPTLSVGQRVLVDRLASPHVGAIFVFHPPVSASAMICANLNQGVGGTGFAQQDGQACDRAVDKPSNVTYIKRIVAGPGDRLSIVNGHAILNGKREPDSYINPCDGAPNCDFPRTIVIPPGHWFMMGDNRGDSDDSRYWGPVPTSWLIGQAFFTYWPPDRIGTL